MNHQQPLPPQPNRRWWFVRGRNPQLSLAEIKTVCGEAAYESTGSIVRAFFDNTPLSSSTVLIKQLGGTIKIAEELALHLTEQELLTAMTNELLSVEGKTIFGISIYRATDELKLGALEMLERWGKTIKQTLKQSVQSVRYVESREPILSSVSVDKNGLVKRGREFLVYEEKDGSFSVAKTMAVQPFEELGARDFGRPGRDDTSGMLPPKLALMLINLTGATTNQTLLDPFCGSGTVITEAMVLGFQSIIGSDISEKAVSDTKKNVAWQRAEDVTSAQVKIFQSEAHELAGKLPTASVDAIATEPYLGKPLRGGEARSVLTTQIQELKKMYVAAFIAFAKILKPGGTVVFVIPCFKYQNTWLRIECLKEIKKCGFTTLPLLSDADFVLYARPDQHVGREIWRFKKT